MRVDERGRNYRGFCADPSHYDVGAANQFKLMTDLGLRETHYLLDIGCGSLRAGRLFIVYLRPGHYYAFDPNYWLIEEAIKHELGSELIRKRQPILDNETNFTLTKFGREFDFMLAQSVLSHASLAQIDRCLLEAAKCLRSNGVFAASMHIDAKQSYTGGWSWPTCSHHLRSDIESIVQRYRLTMMVRNDISHLCNQTWVLFQRLI